MPILLVRASLLAVLILPVLTGLALAAGAGAEGKALCWGLALDGYPITGSLLDTVEREVRLPPKIVVFFLQWPSTPQPTGFPGESLDAIWARGVVPCLTWEPMYYQDGREIAVSHGRILNGEYDVFLTSFAKAAKQWGKPLIIRFAHEMNLERYHWGTEREAYGPQSPEIYKRLFRYVVSVFRKAGASNVLWAFCPNSESLPNVSFDPQASWNEVAHYYPGDDVVDVLGADGYNWGTTQTKEQNGWDSHWRSFDQLFSSVVAQLRALSPTKPFLIFETATVSEGGDKELWIADAVRKAAEWNLQGLLWFHVRKEQDWRFHHGIGDAYPESLRSALTCSPTWLGPQHGGPAQHNRNRN